MHKRKIDDIPKTVLRTVWPKYNTQHVEERVGYRSHSGQVSGHRATDGLQSRGIPGLAMWHEQMSLGEWLRRARD